VYQTSEILARLNWVIDEVARWGPAVPVALALVVALIEAVILPRRAWTKGVWILAVLLCAAGAIGLLRWEQQRSRATAGDQLVAETTALHGLWSQLDALSQTLPPSSGERPAETFDTVEDALASLSAKLAVVDDQIAALKAGTVGRSIDPETATKLADDLRQYGSYRVVVSCPPGDMEAYAYANQLANILRAAGWDAHGPETTAYPDDGTAVGVSLFVRNPAAPEAAKILIDTFSRFNIPYQSAVAENDAIPDAATVELFVPKKP
jgi:hypothetical protein